MKDFCKSSASGLCYLEDAVGWKGLYHCLAIDCFMPQITAASLSGAERKHQRQLPALEVSFKLKRSWVFLFVCGLVGLCLFVFWLFVFWVFLGFVLFFYLGNLITFVLIHYNINT